MLINKKIQSFTLSEMMVVLVISAIVISLAITVLNLVQQQIKSITANFERTTEINLLEQALTYDFNAYNLFYIPKNHRLICANPKDTVVYHFKQQFVLRNTDTIKLQIAETTLFLEGQKVKEQTIDGLSITLSMKFQNNQLFVFKQKEAAYYMNN